MKVVLCEARPVHVAPLVPLLLTGCCFLPTFPDDVGGLTAADFELISLNGFDPEDNAVDINDYAWSMEYFVPDGRDHGYVYVGTGNDVIGLVYQAIGSVLGLKELGEVSLRPPEIRRYREDIFPLAWERVFDYRDVVAEPDLQTVGIRHMKAYRAQSDGVNYLYAGTAGEVIDIWRTATGGPNSWQRVWSTDTVSSVRGMAEHNGILYIALTDEFPDDEQLGAIWATDGESFWPVVEDGFGNPDNIGVACLASFADWLVAGTMNLATGYEVWKLEGPDTNADPIKIISNGGPSPTNELAGTALVFQGKLYIGGMLNPISNIINGFRAADLIRIDANDEWEIVAGPGSISGYGPGFDHWPNTYFWSMAVHENWFYCATYDQVSPFFNVLENLDKVLVALWGRARRANIIERVGHAGADLYKTQDGITWYPVTFDGFGDVGNYGFRVMKSVGKYLYVGTGNPFDGLEIWRGTSSGN
jgi:hypothetical protein